MIKRPTVLILGAGASQPYGFPLGAGLVDQICSEIIDVKSSRFLTREEILAGHRSPNLSDRLCTQGRQPADVAKFASKLREARPYSLDAFIEARPKFRDVGKAAIADILLRAEGSSTIKTAPIDVDWYRYLLNRILLLRNPDYFTAQAKRLTIVTFNFDRSFELALFSSTGDIWCQGANGTATGD